MTHSEQTQGADKPDDTSPTAGRGQADNLIVASILAPGASVDNVQALLWDRFGPEVSITVNEYQGNDLSAADSEANKKAPDTSPSAASLKLTESLDPILWQFATYMKRAMGGRQVGGEELDHDQAKSAILQAFATAIGQIELPEKREKLSLTKFPFAAGQADGWNDMREVCQAVINDFIKDLEKQRET